MTRFRQQNTLMELESLGKRIAVKIGTIRTW
jgi:hypothetical protein